jgi:hypothetical protein
MSYTCHGATYDQRAAAVAAQLLASQSGSGFAGASAGGAGEALGGASLAPPLPYDTELEQWVLSGSMDGVVRLWHLASRQLLRALVGHSDVVWGLSPLTGECERSGGGGRAGGGLGTAESFVVRDAC